ncbi:hypothetical protein PCK1_000688 [Pneumocystis canis]|nr:hypothetical protein PCK1_000688 [Pneumocystis canis]
MAKSIRSHIKKRFRSIKRKDIFDPVYMARIERLSFRLKNLYNEDVNDLDKMNIDHDKNININNHTEDMNIDNKELSLEKKNDNWKLKKKSSKKQIIRKKNRKKLSFGTKFPDWKRKK